MKNLLEGSVKIDTASSVSEGFSEGYNGWRNYETWAVFLWLTGYQMWANHVSDLLSQVKSQEQAASALQSLVAGNHPLSHTPSLYTDLLTHALQRVYWHDLAAALL